LSQVAPSFVDPKHPDYKRNKFFAGFIAWGQHYCEYAI